MFMNMLHINGSKTPIIPTDEQWCQLYSWVGHFFGRSCGRSCSRSCGRWLEDCAGCPLHHLLVATGITIFKPFHRNNKDCCIEAQPSWRVKSILSGEVINRSSFVSFTDKSSPLWLVVCSTASLFSGPGMISHVLNSGFSRSLILPKRE